MTLETPDNPKTDPLVWKDITPYEAGQKGKVPPTFLAGGIGDVSITIKKVHGRENSYELSFLGHREKLEGQAFKNLEDVKIAALYKLHDWLTFHLNLAEISLQTNWSAPFAEVHEDEAK